MKTKKPIDYVKVMGEIEDIFEKHRITYFEALAILEMLVDSSHRQAHRRVNQSQ